MTTRNDSTGPLGRWLFPGMGVKRWILAMMLGIGMISIGIGYLLVAVYRSATLPGIFYYLTAQFVPREIRGAIFILGGVALTVWAVIQINRALLAPFLQAKGDESLGDVLYRHRTLSGGPTIVCIGGGPGLSIVLRGLRNETANLWGITLSHGPARTRTELGLLTDRILLASQNDLVHRAWLPDGACLEGEAAIFARKAGPAISRLEIRQRNGLIGEAEAEVVQRIREADAIILGPGDLFCSVIPPLLLPDVAEAIRSSDAKKIFVCNIMTQAGRTTEFSVADHVRTVQQAADIQVDYVLVNNRPPSGKLLQAYNDALQSQVVFDPEAADHLSQVTFAKTEDKFMLVEGAFLVEADLMTDVREELLMDSDGREVHKHLTVVRHDPAKLGTALSNLIRSESWRIQAG